MQAGGVITRYVRDEADDPDRQSFPYPQGISATDAHSLEYLSRADDIHPFDSEPDLYAFNFAGHAGKFVYDESGTPVIMPFKKYEINRLIDPANGTDVFTIKTPDGILYTFGSPEFTRSFPVGQGCGKTFTSRQTAWYLTRVDHPQGDFIELTYDGFGQYTYAGSMSQTIPRYLRWWGSLSCDACPVPEYSLECTNMLEITGGYLKSISSPQFGSVTFVASRTREDLGDYKLEQVVIKDKDNQTVRSFSFNYVFSPTGGINGIPDDNKVMRRMFLTKLSENNATGQSTKAHEFEYNDINGMPARLSYAQDHWGYFNGANNEYFVPADPFNITNEFGVKVFQGIGGDREPNWNATAKGILTRVTYPTGGSSELFYEPNDYRSSETVFPSRTPLYVSAQGTGHHVPISNSIDFHNVVGQAVTIYGTASFDGTDPEEVSAIHHKAFVTVQDLTSGDFPVNFVPVDLGQSLPIEVTLTKDHSYRLQITAAGSIVLGGASVSYYAETPNTRPANVKTGGLRVSRLVNHDAATGKTETLHYNYASVATPAVSSGHANKAVRYYEENKTRSLCEAPNSTGGMITSMDCYYGKLFSNSLNNLYAFNGNNVYYETVTISRAEGHALGLEEHWFGTTFDLPGVHMWGANDIISAPYSNNGWDIGLEKAVKYYKRSGKELVLIKSLENNYQLDTRNEKTVKGLVVVRRFDPIYGVNVSHGECNDYNRSLKIESERCVASHLHIWRNSKCVAPGRDIQTITIWEHPCYGQPALPEFILTEGLECLDAVEYDNTSYWFYLSSTKETVYDELGQNGRETIVTYEYQNPQHAQLTRTTFTGSNNKTVVSTSHYIGDYAQGVDNFQSLSEKHIINLPVKTQQIVNNKLTDSRIIRYNDYGQPLELYQYEGPALPAAPAHNENILLPSTDYRKKASWSYANARLTDFLSTVTPATCYKWTLNDTRIHAKVVGAVSSDVFYTGFENDGTIGSAKTGERYLGSGTYHISTNDFNPSPTTELVMTYWYFDGSAWKFSGVLPFSRNISHGQRLDELRVYPRNAEMTTIGYNTHHGLVKSMTDANNVSVYYEYDSFGRLTQVRDEDGNVLTEQQYHYVNN